MRTPPRALTKLFSLSLILATAALLSACEMLAAPDPYGTPVPGPGSVDAAPNNGIACDELAAEALRPDGHHNQGTSCNTSGCHDPQNLGAGAPPFTVAGTVYTNAAGDAPKPGASVWVKDAEGKEVKMITANDGNFYTNEAVVFPVETWSSLCPDTIPMITPIADVGMANCNLGGCHGPQDARIF